MVNGDMSAEMAMDQTASDRVITEALYVALVATRLLRAWHSGAIDSHESMQMLWESLGQIRRAEPGPSPPYLLMGNEHRSSSGERSPANSGLAVGTGVDAGLSQTWEGLTE